MVSSHWPLGVLRMKGCKDGYDVTLFRVCGIIWKHFKLEAFATLEKFHQVEITNIVNVQQFAKFSYLLAPELEEKEEEIQRFSCLDDRQFDDLDISRRGR